MRLLSYTALWLLAGTSVINSASIPTVRDVAIREAEQEVAVPRIFDTRDLHDLEKRRGGGGGKGGGSGGSSSSGGSGGSSSGSSSSGSGSGSSSGSSGSKGGSTSSSSNTGGQSKSGSGTAPSFGGGRFYAGGAAVPYTAGQATRSGISPALIPLAGLGILGGLFAFGAFSYNYNHDYIYPNGTHLPVTCLCAQYSECGCDDNGNQTFIQDIVNNGTNVPTNSSGVTIANVNGTERAFINGTLPNGTTAGGGTSGATQTILNYGGFWVMAVTVLAIVFTN